MVKFNTGYLLGATLALSALGTAPSYAAVDLITNGNFEQTVGVTQSTQINGTNNTNGNVTGWYTSGYSFVFLPNSSATSGSQADTTGTTSGLKLWGPGDGSANGLTNSPAGKNFIAADNNYGQAAINQSVSNLVVGQLYSLSFWWAAAQQYSFSGTTQERWTVTFGNTSQSTIQYNLADKGFSGWMYQTFYFVASSTTQTLSFLASGTPGGQPPFSLLDGVSLVAAPEPATWALMLTGVVGLGAATRFGRRALKSGRNAAAA